MVSAEQDATVFNWGSGPEGGGPADQGPVEVENITDEEAKHLAAAPPSMAIIMGVTSDTVVDLSPGESIIGRHPGNAVCVGNSDISRTHAKLTISDDFSSITIEPLKAMNVTLVNGQAIQGPTPLNDGDSITLGNECILRYLGKGNPERILCERKFIENNIDPITGLWNKNRFMDLGGRQVQAMLLEKKQASLVLLQVVGMKGVRDSQGEAALHGALKAIADQLNSSIEEETTIAHIVEGGFAVLFPGSSINKAFARANAIAEWFGSEPFSHEGTPVALSCSVGLAAARQGVVNLDQLIANTTTALQRAMSLGPNQVRSF